MLLLQMKQLDGEILTVAFIQVTHGELNEVPLETLSAVAQNVFLPMLSSTGNQEGWPDVVAREVTDNLHRFVANSKRTACSRRRGYLQMKAIPFQSNITMHGRIFALESRLIPYMLAVPCLQLMSA